MIDAVHVNIVYVQHQVAVGFRQHRVQELAFAHFLARRCVIGNVFHRDTPAQCVLHFANASGDVTNGFLGEWNRHQVVEMAIVGAIAQVLRVTEDAVIIEEAAQIREELVVQRRRTPNGQRQAVRNKPATFGQ